MEMGPNTCTDLLDDPDDAVVKRDVFGAGNVIHLVQNLQIAEGVAGMTRQGQPVKVDPQLTRNWRIACQTLIKLSKYYAFAVIR